MTNISISISKKLLTDIEKQISGGNRSAKLVKCVECGYEKLMEEKLSASTHE